MNALALVVFLLLASPLSAQANRIPNPNFDSPDISWWTLSPLADTSATWSSFGNPGGSFLLESSYQPVIGGLWVHALGPCFTEPAGIWHVRGDVRLEAEWPGSCRIVFFTYLDPTCSGSPIAPVVEDVPNGVWTPTEEVSGILGPVKSLRPALVMPIYALGGPYRCYFDNLELLGPPQTIEVPTLSATGALTFAVLLAMAAIVRHRRRRGRQVSSGV
jgi:hypothetical protein